MSEIEDSSVLRAKSLDPVASDADASGGSRTGPLTNVQPMLFGTGWIELKDGNDSCRAIFDRHYSRKHYADGRRRKLFVGPGEKMVLMRADGSALFVWRKFISDDGQEGVNCAIFRNEGTDLSTLLIAEAEALAWARWQGARFYTYVDPGKVKPTLIKGPFGLQYPAFGYVFVRAGWLFEGMSKSGKGIFARYSPVSAAPDALSVRARRKAVSGSQIGKPSPTKGTET